MAPHTLTQKIPPYLQTFIVQQDPSLYTPIDHASWRFILKVARAFFARHAHQKYLDGLRETGISLERIPLIEEMDQCLRKFNWRAVAVSGFIPPAAFMEFLSLGILPIACDMRSLEHLSYTPAPDIVHEAAGHAPIIADQEYASYLRSYGEVSRKAIYSKQDLEVYHAIRNLSEVKENPASTPDAIAVAQRRLDEAVAAVDYITEATDLARMNWWTVEYGLVGDLRDPKIYGAGLLSSLGESYHCLEDRVKKIPLSLRCVDTAYDITRPQPQLFVARDFPELTKVLEEFADTMAFRKGGVEGLEKARRAAALATVVFDSGIQMGGVLADYLKDQKGEPVYLRFQGPTQLAFRDGELEGQGPGHHEPGFGTPVGVLKGTRKSPAELTDSELTEGRLEFESGVTVEGKLKGKIRRDGKNLVVTFESCTVRRGDEILFDPAWGVFDMACGARVVSVFGGPPDHRRYLEATGGFKQAAGHPKTNLTEANRTLNALYARVRTLRDGGKASLTDLASIHEELEENYPDDWLLRIELLELNSVRALKAPWEATVRERLAKIACHSADKQELIGRGLAVI